MPDIDFAAIKEAVSIEAAARFLGLKLIQQGDTFRCPCPVCKRAGDRALIITPAKRAFYCHGTCKTGGDAIKLMAHIRGTNQTQAAKTLMEQFMQEPPTKNKKPRVATSGSKLKQERQTPSVYAGGTENPAEETDYSIVDYLQQFGG